MYISDDFLQNNYYEIKKINYFYFVIIFILGLFVYYLTYTKEKIKQQPKLELIYESHNFNDILIYNESNNESNLL